MFPCLADNGISDKVPSIRVYSIPSEKAVGGVTEDEHGIPTAARFAEGDRQAGGSGVGGENGAADVWEFTEEDLDNIGSGTNNYGSDDDWSYAENATGIDTKSDPGETRSSRSRRRSSLGVQSSVASSEATSQQRRGRDVTKHTRSRDGGDVGEAPKSYLNGRITKLHRVRAEPIKDAAVVGYLVATKEV
ncbi:unnamed protein product, partial [Sphacelaria rigidula]